LKIYDYGKTISLGADQTGGLFFTVEVVKDGSWGSF